MYSRGNHCNLLAVFSSQLVHKYCCSTCSFLCDHFCMFVCCLVWDPTQKECLTTKRSAARLLFNWQGSAWIFILDLVRCRWSVVTLSTHHFIEECSLHTLFQNKKAWNNSCRWSHVILDDKVMVNSKLKFEFDQYQFSFDTVSRHVHVCF